MSSRSLSALALLVAASLLVIGCSEPPQSEPEPPPEPSLPPVTADAFAHFLCYESTALGSGAYPPIEVQDQFDRNWARYNLLPGGERFCNPVVKRHGGTDSTIPNHDHHLVAINGGSPDPPAEGSVTVFNQFFPEGQELSIELAMGQYLMVPATKTGMDPVPPGWDGHGEPDGLSHFKCYPVKENQSPDAVVDLIDQVDTYQDVAIMDAELLCNPTKKKHGDQEFPIEPIDGELDHLVCYNIDRAARVNFRATHQLRPGGDSFEAEGLAWLCVPSTKVHGMGWWSAESDPEDS